PPIIPTDWLEDFHPFTLLHLLSVLAFGSLIAAACIRGRLLGHGSPGERRLRLVVGVATIVLAFVRLAYYLSPVRRDLPSNLPILFALATAVFTLLWAIWPMMDRLRSRAPSTT